MLLLFFSCATRQGDFFCKHCGSPHLHPAFFTSCCFLLALLTFALFPYQADLLIFFSCSCFLKDSCRIECISLSLKLKGEQLISWTVWSLNKKSLIPSKSSTEIRFSCLTKIDKFHINCVNLSVLLFCPGSQFADRKLYVPCYSLRALNEAPDNSQSFLVSEQDSKTFWFLLFIFHTYPPIYLVSRLWSCFMCLKKYVQKTWDDQWSFFSTLCLATSNLKPEKQPEFQRKWVRRTCICEVGVDYICEVFCLS